MKGRASEIRRCDIPYSNRRARRPFRFSHRRQAGSGVMRSDVSSSGELCPRRAICGGTEGRIDEPQYLEAVDRWNAQRQAGGGEGGNYYWTKLTYLGRDYVALALSEFHQNRIDENQLADFLDTKPKNVGTLEDYFGRGGA